MRILSIDGGQVFLPDKGLHTTNIMIENGIISQLSAHMSKGAHSIQLEAEDIVLPGRIDGHIHGAHGHDVMDADSKAIEEIAKSLPSEGTTSFLPTTMTASTENIERALSSVGAYIKSENKAGKAEVIGVHLEGPFISREKIGAQNPKFIQKPNIELFKSWYERSNESIKVVTVAPEMEGAIPFIKELRKNGIVASIGHSNATFSEVEKAIAAGASQFTHLYNGMRSIHHREPGVVGAAFLRSDTIAEIIVDGLHSHPEMVRFAYEAKGKNGLMLITDSMRAKCLGDGDYDLGGQSVHVKEGRATLKDGTLAGSILTMQTAFSNMKQFTDADLSGLVAMMSINPAKQFGIDDRKGSIETGKDADFIILDRFGELKMTICRGELAYTRGC